MDRSEVIASAASAAEYEVEIIRKAVVQKQAEFSKSGNLGNSRTIFVYQDVIADGFRRIADQTAIRFAEISSEEAASYADSLAAILRGYQDRLEQLYEKITNLYRAQHREWIKADELQGRLRNIVDRAERDLRLGIAAGVNVARQAGVSISAKIANVQAYSPHAKQVVSGSQSIVDAWDPAPLLVQLQEIRQALGGLGETDARDNAEDAVVALEREAGDAAPNQGRLRRLATAAVTRLEAIGLNLLSSSIWERLPPMA